MDELIQTEKTNPKKVIRPEAPGKAKEEDHCNKECGSKAS